MDLTRLSADIAVMGIHYTSPYPQTAGTPFAGNNPKGAPEAIRRQSQVFSGHWDHYDFDFGGPLLPDPLIRVVDCGDAGVSPDSTNGLF